MLYHVKLHCINNAWRRDCQINDRAEAPDYPADVRAGSAELDGPVDAQVVRGDDGLAADRVHPGDHPLQRRGLFDRDAVDALLQQLSDPEAVLGHDLYAGADAVHEDLDALLRARYTQADRRRGRFVAADLRPIADQSAEFRRLRLVGVRQRDLLFIPEAGVGSYKLT